MTAPFRGCPECGEPLIPASERGRFDRDGNFIQHRADCRCRHCEWIWWEDQALVTCACGCIAKIEVDDGVAYAVAVTSAEHVRPELPEQRRG